MRIHSYIKKLLTYLILSLYVFIVLKPIIPVVSDFIAHQLFEQQHIANVHYENGKFHLHIELVNAAKDKPSKQTSASIFFELIQQHILEKMIALQIFHKIIDFSFMDLNQSNLSGFSNIQTPPPKA